jgi:putative spermidine/putrescine transport system substrate-binding protein
MKELGEGARDLTVSTSGWDLNPRALGIVPKSFAVTPFRKMTWINDTEYLMVPAGVDPQKIGTVLDLMKFLLEPEQQALTYDKGFFYPGPAVRDVPLSMAPPESQSLIREFGRPEYDGWFATFPHEQPLDAKLMLQAFARWDKEIGALK